MSDPRLDELGAEEFQAMMNGLLSDDFDKVTVTEFFGSLAAMDESSPEIIELTAHIESGQLILEEPAPLLVVGNEIQISNKRIIITLRENAQAA